jgi:excisionase family DNA binding protein
MIERLTTQEAAKRLGVSVATIRRRIAAGELQGESDVRPQGTRWYVLLPTDQTDHDTAHETSHGTSHTAHQTESHAADDAPRDVSALMLERADDEILYLRKKLDELTELLAREQQTRLLLQAPREASDSAHGTSQAPVAQESINTIENAPQSAPQRPWWRFW